MVEVVVDIMRARACVFALTATEEERQFLNQYQIRSFT